MANSALLWSIVAVAAWGVCPVLEKLGILRMSPTLMMFFHSIIITLVLGCFCFYRMKSGQAPSVQFDWSTVAIVVAVALVGGLLGEYAYYRAMMDSETSRAVAITSAYPLVTIMVSMIALGEQITLSSGCGALMVIAGVALLSSGGGA